MHPSPLHRPAGALPEAQPRHQPHRLGGDPPGHLALALPAFAKDDRNLDDPEARAHGAVGELDLKGVSLRAHVVELDRLEHLSPEALEATGQVAHMEAEHPQGVRRYDLDDEAT